MATLRSRPPHTSKTLQVVEVDDMTAGVDLRATQTLMRPNRARVLRNYALAEVGALTVLPGYLQASSASLGAGRAQGAQRVYLASTQFSLVAWNGAVKSPTDAWVFGADVMTGLSSANDVFFPYDRDLVMVMDGLNRPKFSTNGTTWSLAGTDAPSLAATLSSLSTGGLSSGEYAIAYTYKHRGTGHESNPSSESTITITASSGAITATASPSTDTKNDAYVWYARHKQPDLESVLRKISSGSSATIIITSSAWTSNNEAPSNHAVPATGLRFAVIWKNRWWAADGTVGNRVRFTEIFQPQTWPTTYYIDIPFEYGNSITAMQPLGDALIVFGQSGAYIIVGQTSLDFEVRPSQGAATGALGQRAVDRVEQTVVHAGIDGVYSFDGATDRDLSRDIAPGWRDFIANTASTTAAKVALVHHPRAHMVRVSVPRVYPTAAPGEWTLFLDRTRDNDGRPAWATTDRTIAHYMPWSGNEPTAGHQGRLFSMASSVGLAFEEYTGTTANSSNMVAEYEGPALPFGLHQTRAIGVHVEHETHSGTFAIDVVADGTPTGAISLNIGAGLFPYGTASATYGTASRLYGGATRAKAYTELPISASGRALVLKTVYTGQEAFRHFTYAFEVVPEPRPRRM
jgi:hypothetical protein